MNGKVKLNVAAGIIAFHPDKKKISLLLKALSTQVDTIFVFNNGGFDSQDALQMSAPAITEVLGTGKNLGIGEALNAIIHLSQSRGARQLITFDQDSHPPANMVAELSKELYSLQAAGINAAATGPTIIDQRNGAFSFPVFQTGHFWINKRILSDEDHAPIQTILLITSGMLVDIRAFESIGNFKPEYFIDYVDTEWCLRGISKGFSFFICPKIHMYHELSLDRPRRVLGRMVLKYASTRRYYAFRNAWFLLCEKHCPIYMKLYLLATLVYRFFLNLIIDSSPRATLRAMLFGLRDGLLGRGGEFPSQG